MKLFKIILIFCLFNKIEGQKLSLSLSNFNDVDRTFDIEIKNNTNQLIMILNVFEESKFQDFNFFLEGKNRFLFEEIEIEGKKILLDERIHCAKNFDFEYDKNLKKSKILDTNSKLKNNKLKSDHFIYILANECKKIKYHFNEVKCYYDFYKNYNYINSFFCK